MAEVALIVDLYSGTNFSGTFRTLVRSLNNFNAIEFTRRTASVVVSAGPNYRGEFIRLWSNANYQGVPLEIPVGSFPSLAPYNYINRAASMQIVRPSGTLLAEDRRTETVEYQFRVVPPTGTALTGGVQSRVLNPIATGSFVGASGVRVDGQLEEEVIVAVSQPDGSAQNGTGRTKLPFTRDIDFPQITGIDPNQLTIRAFVSDATASHISKGDTVVRTVTFTLTTQVLRRERETATQLELDLKAESPSE